MTDVFVYCFVFLRLGGLFNMKTAFTEHFYAAKYGQLPVWAFSDSLYVNRSRVVRKKGFSATRKDVHNVKPANIGQSALFLCGFRFSKSSQFMINYRDGLLVTVYAIGRVYVSRTTGLR